jgi:hypothetical protein
LPCCSWAAADIIVCGASVQLSYYRSQSFTDP